MFSDIHGICVRVLEVIPLLILLVACLWPLLGKVLWACRVSVISALAGYYLFLLVLQAQDLFADTSLGNRWPLHILYWSGAFAALFLIWAFPVHYAARKVLDDTERDWLAEADYDEKTLHRLQNYVPRILGAIPIVAFLIGIGSAWYETRNILSLVPYLETQFVLLTLGALATLAFFIWFVVARKELVAAYMGPRSTKLTERASLIVTGFIVFLFCVFPIPITQYISRAMMIPFLFGSWVLCFNVIARLAQKWRRPLFLFLVAGLAILIGLNTHFDDLRTMPHDKAAKSPLADRQLELEQAVTRWRVANGCDDSQATDIKDCPPALIIASEGGASRAAFFSAGVIGQILDQVSGSLLNDKAAAQLQNPARRIFAMSGVSGGAFGLSVIKAALLDSVGGRPPCVNGNTDQQYFKTNHKDYLTGNPLGGAIIPLAAGTWHDCLEMLTDGDYLSPVFVGLGYRDNIAIWPFTWADRAALLEQAWEEHYLRLTADDQQTKTCASQLDNRGLCRPLGYSDGAGDVWTPLLLLNGTSVQTGRRIIASELKSTFINKPNEHPPLNQWAYDLFEMLGAPCPSMDPLIPSCAAISVDAGPDIRLSTSALLSARFPLISPAGNIPLADGVHGDAVVDGGYFENSGLTTASSIARELHKIGLKPIILSISNDPLPPVETDVSDKKKPEDTASASDGFIACDDASLRKCSPSNGDVGKFVGPDASRSVMPNHCGAGPTIEAAPNLTARTFGLLGAPISALYNTRSGHGDEAGAAVARELDEWYVLDSCEEVPPSFFPFKVFAHPELEKRDPPLTPFEMPEVSMSWWLSPAAQRSLDGQLAAVPNKDQFDFLMKRLKRVEASKP